MRVLMVNKFLYPNGGSETYCFTLASHLEKMGHRVQFFGMHDERNVVGNELGLYVSNVEFSKMTIKKALYPLKIIYSFEAKKKIRKLIQHFKPSIVHLNNYNFQITPSILYEIKRHDIPIVMTLHDFQVICPNHMLYIEHKKQICEQCKGRKYINCIKNKCIHNSLTKSVLAAFEGALYYKLHTYEKYIDCFISPSQFLKNKIIEFGEPAKKIRVIPNFISNSVSMEEKEKRNYILYFGRLSIQKGILTLIEACKRLPHINFVVAGDGPLAEEIHKIENINYVGFQSGEALSDLIANALFSVYPSEWYENSPMSVLESQKYGTPVLGADIGGIPELIQDKHDGLLFEPGNVNDLVSKITYLYNNRELLRTFTQNCGIKIKSYSAEKYYHNLMEVYNDAVKNI